MRINTLMSGKVVVIIGRISRFDLKWAKLLRSVNSTNCNLIRGLNFRAQFIGDGFADWFSKPDPAEPDFQTGEDPVCDRFMVNRGS